MRLSGISRIIEAAVGDNRGANRGLNNSQYPAKTEFNNNFIIYMYYYQNIDLITTNAYNNNIVLHFAGVRKNDAISTSWKLLFASVTS